MTGRKEKIQELLPKLNIIFTSKYPWTFVGDFRLTEKYKNIGLLLQVPNPSQWINNHISEAKKLFKKVENIEGNYYFDGIKLNLINNI